jgi:gliding motility-associated-like protein
MFFKKLRLVFILFIGLFTNSLIVNAQCDPNQKYDRIVSGFHQSAALKKSGIFAVWGQDIGSSGTGDVLAPQDLNSTNYSGLTGTVLKVSIGGEGGLGTEQAIALTTDGLFAWGNVGKVLANSLTTSAAFQKIKTPTGGNTNATTKLPTEVNPSDVVMMQASNQTLAILTNSGNVWMLTQASLALEGNGGSASTAGSSSWKKVKTSSNTDLTNVTAIRGQVSNRNYNAFTALTSSGEVYTWGSSVYLGNNTASTSASYATLMTIPAEFSSSNVPKMIGVTGGINGDSNRKNTYFILSNNGSLYALGDNSARQCGDFTTDERRVWVKSKINSSTEFSNVNFISVQEHDAWVPGVSVTTFSGDLYTWGVNSGLMLGRTTADVDYDPGLPGGFTSGTDKAIFSELGGHTLVYIKEGTTKFCYVGHKTAGSMGDGTNSSTNINTFDCINTPNVEICGSVPVVASTANSTISVNPTSITANGNSTSTITIQLKDANGNNLTTSGGVVVVTTSQGSLGQVVDNNNGTYTVLLTSSSNTGTATINFKINGNNATNSTSVAFLAPPANNAPTDLALSQTSINENNSTGAVVGSLSSTDQDAGDTHTYTLVSGTGSTDNALFTIDGTNLKTTVSFDFETKNSYTIRIRTKDAGGLFFEKAFTITISDLDDTAPNLIGPGGATAPATASSAILIPENTIPVFTFTSNETVTWSISGTDASFFTIGTDGKLVFNAVPDFENPLDNGANNTYIVVIKAVDAALNETTQTLTVTVTNVDDTAPNLIGPGGSTAPATATSAISIPENTLPVFTFTSNETPVTWSISGTDAAFFTIGTDGKLVFNAAPDFENPLDNGANNTYVVVVKAVDAGLNETTQTLTVTVTNVDDTAPNVIGPGGSTAPATATSAISIPENNTPVFTFTSNETVTWSISGTDASFFSIGSDGKLVFNLAPDFENPLDNGANNTYVVVVKAVDAGLNETSQTLTVTITNVDDTAPNLVGPGGSTAPATATSAISVPENTTPVFTFTSNETVTWSISGTDAAFFTIGTDGKLVFNAAPDFELPGDSDNNNTYIVIVKARDAAGNETTQTLTVTVTNVDDTAPNLVGPGGSTAPATATSSISIPENTTPVFTFTSNETVTWSISGTDAALFTIGTDGKLVFNAAPDFELPGDSDNNNTYIVIVKARDAAGNETTQTLTVTVTNVDDTAPNLVGPGGSTAPATATSAISIPENTIPVFTFTSNETVTWSISGTDASLFTIGTDGKLVFKVAPDFENPGDSDKNNTYIVVVKAVDTAGNETIQTLTVTVSNVDDTAPSIVGPDGATAPATGSASIYVAENTKDVFSYTSNESVTWSISGTDAALFTIGTDGKLVFNVAPDYELPADSNKDNVYEIIVKAVDAAGNETIQILLVTVSDVDDTAPVISGPAGSKGATAAISVPENSTAVFSYTADESVTWSISGTDASLVTIGTDGKLVFKSAPNFELPSDSDKNNSYVLVITAKDASNNSSTQTLTVNVLNVNEAPANLSLTTSVIYENNVLNALIGYLGSTDVDAGDTFKYSIVGGDTGSFIITGNELKANAVFVYGTKSNYTIILRTTDAGGLSFDKTVNISIAEAPKLFGIANQPGNKKSAASGGNVTISKGYSVNLNLSGSNIVSYNWSPSTGLNSTNISNPTANPTKTTTYTVTVTNAQGISTTLYITVTVIEDFNITPNNVISPNGDGVNDVWVIENLSTYPNNEVKIFDKAGRVIYNIKNYQNNWNGQLNGELLHDGAYYYIINLGAGSRAKVGYITLFSNQ